MDFAESCFVRKVSVGGLGKPDSHLVFRLHTRMVPVGVFPVLALRILVVFFYLLMYSKSIAKFCHDKVLKSCPKFFSTKFIC